VRPRHLALAAAALLSIGGCGGDEAPAGAEVLVAGFEFEADPVRVRAGTAVTWRNADEAPHTATGRTFDTGRLRLGEAGEVEFSEPGSYPYYCVFHRFMTGTVEVVE
jgi:plastocyanin